jgi:hypothetical protein
MTGPTIQSVSPMSLSMTSALGIDKSGDSGTAEVTVGIKMNVQNTTVFQDSALSCNNQLTTSLMCSVDTTGLTLTKAISNSAVDVAKTNLTVGQKKEIIERAFNIGNCNMGLQIPTSTWVAAAGTSIKIPTLNSSAGSGVDEYRCVQATFNMNVSLRVQTADNMNKVYTSAAKAIPMTITSNCTPEAWLTPGYELPLNAQYGNRVAIDGNWAVVVADRENDPGSVSTVEIGAAHVFKKMDSVWTHVDKLKISTNGNNDGISSVALKGNYLILGSAGARYVPQSSSDTGSGKTGVISLFKLNQGKWQELGKPFSLQNANEEQMFGAAVAIDDGRAFIGAPGRSLSNGQGGVIYSQGVVMVYKIDDSLGLVDPQTLTSPIGNITSFRGYGSSLAAKNGLLAVGAPMYPGKETQGIGAVHLYNTAYIDDAKTRMSPIEVRTYGGNITEADNTDLHLGARFGARVDISGIGLVIGIPTRGDNNTDKVNLGQIRYYANWAQTTAPVKINGSTANDRIGREVKLTSDKIFLAVTPEITGAQGMVQVRNRSTPTAVVRHIRPLDSAGNDYFGVSIAIGETDALGKTDMLIGARGKRKTVDSVVSSGAAYMYSLGF